VLFAQNNWTDRVYLAHFSAPLYLFVVGTILIRRFTESLNAYEKLAAVLEQRVGEKAAALERNYEQLLEARRNEALALERTRIMSEMHDGIGSQLTMALSLVRGMDREANPAHNGEDGPRGHGAAREHRGPAADHRLAGAGRARPAHRVGDAARYRLQDRLGKGGIDLQWNVVDLPPLPMLTPAQRAVDPAHRPGGLRQLPEALGGDLHRCHHQGSRASRARGETGSTSASSTNGPWTAAQPRRRPRTGRTCGAAPPRSTASCTSPSQAGRTEVPARIPHPAPVRRLTAAQAVPHFGGGFSASGDLLPINCTHF